MSFIKLLILGIIQGISEWLPISSSAHLLLYEKWANVSMYPDPFLNANFLNLLTVVIQLGSVGAVMMLFNRQLNPFDPRKSKKGKAITYGLWIKIIVAALPSLLVGITLSRFADHYFHNEIVIAIMLIVIGILFIVVENHSVPLRIRKLNQMDLLTAFKIGCVQTVAIIPGASRSGSSILAALMEGVDRKVACEFSFLISIPVIIGASLLKIIQYSAGITFGGWLYVIGGCLISFIVSLFVIRILINYIKTHDFRVFGIYRILLAIVVIISIFL